MASKSQSGRVAPSQRRQRRTGLSRDQLALIHVARRDRRLEEDEYRHLLKEAAGVESAKELDAAGFTKVLNRFK